MKALVVGGSGPTGPHVVAGLRERGFEVTIFHRGVHELPELDDLEHIHGDPHFRETVEDALAGRRFDLVIAMYGRLRNVADAVAGFCDIFIGVSGVPVYRGYLEPDASWPRGVPVFADETADTGGDDGETPRTAAARFTRAIGSAERAVLDLGKSGAFRATLFRYPRIYGPRQLNPFEWSVIKRVLDERPFMILPDNGLTVETRCATRNAARHLLLAVDHGKEAAGEIFNIADEQQYSLRQWTQLTSSFAGRELEIVPLPFALAGPAKDILGRADDDNALVSAEKAKRLLGYADAVSAREALKEAVEWYVQHPPADTETMSDKFDYRLEDGLVDQYQQATAEIAATQSPAVAPPHPYPHPKQPGMLRDEHGR
jgi:nucleoside-diphosphate-sugar epimerase